MLLCRIEDDLTLLRVPRILSSTRCMQGSLTARSEEISGSTYALTCNLSSMSALEVLKRGEWVQFINHSQLTLQVVRSAQPCKTSPKTSISVSSKYRLRVIWESGKSSPPDHKSLVSLSLMPASNSKKPFLRWRVCQEIWTSTRAPTPSTSFWLTIQSASTYSIKLEEGPPLRTAWWSLECKFRVTWEARFKRGRSRKASTSNRRQWQIHLFVRTSFSTPHSNSHFRRCQTKPARAFSTKRVHATHHLLEAPTRATLYTLTGPLHHRKG